MNTINIEYEEAYELGPDDVSFHNCTPSSMHIDESVLSGLDFSCVQILNFSVEHYEAPWMDSNNYMFTYLDLYIRSGKNENAVIKLRFRGSYPDLNGLMVIMENIFSLTISYHCISVEGDVKLDHTAFDVVFTQINQFSGETKVWKTSPDWVSLQKYIIDE